MAEAVVSFLITKLGELAIAEAGSLVQGQLQIRDDVKFIKDELSTMEAFLRDAEQKSIRDDSVREWVAQVRDAAYKVEDVLEEFLVRMLVINNSRRRATGCVDLRFCISNLSFLRKQFVLRHRFHSQMLTMRRELKEISQRRHQYNLEGICMTSSQENEVNHDASYPFQEEADIVGIDEDVKQLREWLIDERHHRLIVSVVGTGGSGKTTLVKKVYNHTKGLFDCYAWISVSQDFKMQQNLQLMLKRFYDNRSEEIPDHADKMITEELIENIHNYLQARRYLLILDDVWDAKVWESIKHALPREGRGRIIITTRLVTLSSPVDEVCNVHHMDPLSQKLAWELFCRKAFRNSNPQGCCPQHLRHTGKGLVKKCDGLPLAIVAIGGLMSKKSSRLSEWDEVLENLDWELNHHPDLEKLGRVLLTSYNYLPPTLKYCFLYCGMFPENYRIKTSRLIRIWIADGIISNHPRKTLEEVAFDYLSQLVDRGFLQVDNHASIAELKACQVHDLMRDVAIHMSKKEQFGDILTNQRKNIVFKGQRRVAIHSNEVSVQQNMACMNTRSFQIFSEIRKPFDTLLSLLSNLKQLRVLDLSGTNIEHLPNEVGDLLHLRYLSLRRTQVSELPTTLQNLHNLQTLDVRNTTITSFPQGMGVAMLKQLRHLLLRHRRDRIGFSLQNFIIDPNSLINLQTLSGAVADESLLRQLEYLTSLRKLYLTDVEGQHYMELCSSIKKMQNLRVLRIRCKSYDEVLDFETMSPPSRYLEKLFLAGTMKGVLPPWIGFLNCLHTVHLYYSLLQEDPMSTFSRLPSLEVLLLVEAYSGRKMSWGDNCDELFPRLKLLVISDMLELEELSEIKDGMMQSLVFLTIFRCPKLKKLPVGFQHLKALGHLYFSDMHQDFMKRLRPCQLEGDESNGGEDHWMIRHIPRVLIGTYGSEGQRRRIITERLPTVGE